MLSTSIKHIPELGFIDLSHITWVGEITFDSVDTVIFFEITTILREKALSVHSGWTGYDSLMEIPEDCEDLQKIKKAYTNLITEWKKWKKENIYD